MKKLYTLFFAAIFCASAYAQTVNTSVKSATNYKFDLLEKNRIPYNILTDYGYDFIEIEKYNGSLQADNYLNIGRYSELYNTLVSSKTSANVFGLFSPSQERAEWKNLQDQANSANYDTDTAQIILSGLQYRYSRFHPDALANNRIRVINNSRYDDKYINGVWQNPYQTRYTFAMVAPVKQIKKARVSVQLPNTLWHSNVSTGTIEINFGDGSGYKNIKNGAVATTTYNRTGEYTWTYRIRPSASRTYQYARQKVNVSFPKTIAYNKINNCERRIEVIPATRAFQGVFGDATVEVAYGSPTCTIRNPLIVAEGLDTALVGQGGGLGDTDLNDFLQATGTSGSFDLRQLINNNSAIDFDIIYVNWNNGTDFLQRNAFVLEAVIDWVNQEKASNGSTTPNIVLGQSMGGVIARYALKDMENNNEDHDTRLYVSHDAPHQGAHLPLGVSYMARHLVDQFIETPLGGIDIPVANSELSLGSLGDLLDAPAVQQLLINNVNDELQLDNTMHDAWQAELEAMGYPQDTRNVSLSNGSHCGEGQGLLSNQKLLDVYGKGGTGFLTDIALLFLPAALGSAPGVILEDLGTALLGFLPGNSSLTADFEVSAFPEVGTSRIYKGRLTYKKTLLWVVPITRTITNRSYNSPANALFQDNFPGGIAPIGNLIADISEFESNVFFNYELDVSITPNFSFISSASALDVGSGATTLSAADYSRPYVASDPPSGSLAIPFDNFSTTFNEAGTNEPHISFNQRNGNWLAEELDVDAIQDIFDCTIACDNLEIQGSDYLCSQGTYFIDGDPTDLTVTWDVIGNVNAFNIISATGTDLVLQAVSGYRTSIDIRATITSQMCNTTIVVLREDIRIGAPGMPSFINGHAEVETGANTSYHAGPSEGATSYRWYLPQPFLSVTNFDYSSDLWQLRTPWNIDVAQVFTGLGEIDGQVQVAGVNPCGESGARSMDVVHERGGGGGIARVAQEEVSLIKLYPNPSSDTVFIGLTNDGDLGGTEILDLAVYDMNMVAQNITYAGRDTSLQEFSVSGLRRGIYSVEVRTNQGLEIKRLIVM